MKAIVPFLALLLISFITLSQENLKDLSAYEDVNVKIEVDFNPSVILVLEEKEFDKLLLGEKLSAFLEMNDFKIASLQAGKAAENAYLLRYNYEYIVDKKKCGGTIIKVMNGKIVDMKRQNVLATFNFEQKGNKICSDDILKVLAYKLKRGS